MFLASRTKLVCFLRMSFNLLYIGLLVVIPVCTDDLLLHFPYDDHFNDVTCHHAIGTKYGAGVVSIVNDTERGRVAWFDGNARLEVRRRSR